MARARTLLTGNFGDVCRSRRGYTLLELLVVLAVIGAISVLAFSAVHPRSNAQEIRIVALDLQSDLRKARLAATERGEVVDVTFDLANRSWYVGGAKAKAIPSGISISVVVALSGDEESGKAHITFFPDGSSSGGDIHMNKQAAEVGLRIDWLTGRTRVDGE